MTRSYVTFADPIHELLRNVTHFTPLEPVALPGADLDLRYSFRPDDLPETYYTLAVYHSLEGIPFGKVQFDRWRARPECKAYLPAQVNFFDVTKLDRRCSRDIRLKLPKNGPGMLSADLLCFGVGMLRARNDDPAEVLFADMLARYGRLQSRLEIVHARVHTLHWNSLPILPFPSKESYDSTNVIYGDAHGELLQLWDRRADTDYLGKVAKYLQRIRRSAEIAADCHPPLSLPTMLQMHLRAQAVWRQPPPTARSLLHRLEFLLDQTVIDQDAATVCAAPASDRPGLRSPERDRSGYDGWLSEPGGFN